MLAVAGNHDDQDERAEREPDYPAPDASALGRRRLAQDPGSPRRCPELCPDIGRELAVVIVSVEPPCRNVLVDSIAHKVQFPGTIDRLRRYFNRLT
jgi:hypothetical protein